MGMDQYLLIQFLVGWTSIYQLFWCSPGVQGFDTLPYGRWYSWMLWDNHSSHRGPTPRLFFKGMWPQICVNSLRNHNFCVSHCGEEKTSDSNTLISCTCMFILMVQVPVYLGQHCTFQTHMISTLNWFYPQKSGVPFVFVIISSIFHFPMCLCVFP